MEFSKEIYGALGCVFGALIALYGVLYKRNIEDMKSDIACMGSQLLSYYELERIYSIKIASLDPDKPSSIRVKVLARNQVEDIGKMERPRAEKAKIKEIIRRWS